jgi:hypothetical protein
VPELPGIRLYAAGKISKGMCGEVLPSDWRCSVLQVCPVRESDSRSGEGWRDPVPVPGLPNAVYVGPHVDPSDHTCSDNCQRVREGRPAKPAIAAGCLFALRQATHVFAWVDSLEVYGTLVEIGYALALGRSVHFYWQDGTFGMDELWLAGQVSLASAPAKSIEDAWFDFLLRVGIPPPSFPSSNEEWPTGNGQIRVGSVD